MKDGELVDDGIVNYLIVRASRVRFTAYLCVNSSNDHQKQTCFPLVAHPFSALLGVRLCHMSTFRREPSALVPDHDAEAFENRIAWSNLVIVRPIFVISPVW